MDLILLSSFLDLEIVAGFREIEHLLFLDTLGREVIVLWLVVLAWRLFLEFDLD